MKKTYIIHADIQVKVWQACVFEVEADNEEQAKQMVIDKPMHTCIGCETLDNTEDFIQIDTNQNFEVEAK